MKQVILYLEALKQQTQDRINYYDYIIENSKSELLKTAYKERIDELKIVISEIEMKIFFLKK